MSITIHPFKPGDYYQTSSEDCNFRAAECPSTGRTGAAFAFSSNDIIHSFSEVGRGKIAHPGFSNPSDISEKHETSWLRYVARQKKPFSFDFMFGLRPGETIEDFSTLFPISEREKLAALVLVASELGTEIKVSGFGVIIHNFSEGEFYEHCHQLYRNDVDF
jgi:hypothetical protein